MFREAGTSSPIIVERVRGPIGFDVDISNLSKTKELVPFELGAVGAVDAS